MSDKSTLPKMRKATTLSRETRRLASIFRDYPGVHHLHRQHGRTLLAVELYGGAEKVLQRLGRNAPPGRLQEAYALALDEIRSLRIDAGIWADAMNAVPSSAEKGARS